MTHTTASGAPLAPRDAGQWLRATLGPAAHVTPDSRAVAPGHGFLAFPGRRADGRRFIAQALANGAGAIVIHDDGVSAPNAMPAGSSIPMCSVRGLDQYAGDVAASFYDDPSRHMQVTAVTGTNGKTSCANWIASGLPAAGTIGTLGVRRVNRAAHAPTQEALSASLTTPDAVSLQRSLAALHRDGVTQVALEASSIGLDQARLAGVAIDVAVFTNLTRDHLDYHGTLSAYRQAKQRLFERPELGTAIVNGDDPAATAMLAATRGEGRDVRCIAYGFEPSRYAPGCGETLRIAAFESTASGSLLTLEGRLGSTSVPRTRVPLKLVGRFNAVNATAVCACWVAMGMPFEQAAAQLAALEPVMGRMQVVADDTAGGPLAVVDYAHTPQALESALDALLEIAGRRGGQLWCVFGCGGDRDAGKRPEMAAAAEARAHHLVLTSDNPRHESPDAILAQMLAGLTRTPAVVESDRARAIAMAIASADAGDVVLIAGKGHEATQEVAGRKLPFSDVDHAARALRVRGGPQAGGAQAGDAHA